MSTQIRYSDKIPYNNQEPTQVGDIIEHLPSDQTIPSHNEIRLLDTLFKKEQGIMVKLLKNIKDILIIGLLFVFFSLPPVDDIIKKFISITNTSEHILIGVKAILVMLLYFLITNIALAQKN